MTGSEHSPAPLLTFCRNSAHVPWETVVLPVVSKVLGVPMDVVDSQNIFPRTGCRISDSDLNRVRNCTYLIVDLSDDEPVSALVLGLALAHRKPFLLVCSARKRAKLQIPGHHARCYDSESDLAGYLRQVVGYWEEMVDRRAQTIVLDDLFKRACLGLAVLEGDGRYEYEISPSGERPIVVNLARKRFVPEAPWAEIFKGVSDQQRLGAEAEGRVLFNGELVRVSDYAPTRDETAGTRGLRLDGQLTSYFDFVSSNHCWDSLSGSVSRSLRSRECATGIESLRDSQLANPLSVVMSLVLRDRGTEWLVIQRRNKSKNFHGRHDFVSAAAGMVSATRDMRSGRVDVYSTAVNELWEETGLHVQESDVRFLALVRETSLREVSLIGEVEIDQDPETALGIRADSFESIGFVACRATPEALVEFIRLHMPYSRFSPVSVASWIFSLLRRFSIDRVEKAVLSLQLSSEDVA